VEGTVEYNAYCMLLVAQRYGKWEPVKQECRSNRFNKDDSPVSHPIGTRNASENL
jgi:hypothetical protein